MRFFEVVEKRCFDRKEIHCQPGAQRHLGDYSLTKADRLLARKDFLRLSLNGKRVQNRRFIIYHAKNNCACSRLGVTVSKKIGNAVQRNRIKRLSRETFRRNRQRLGCFRDINIIAKRGVAELSSEEIFSSIENLFDQISNEQQGG